MAEVLPASNLARLVGGADPHQAPNFVGPCPSLLGTCVLKLGYACKC
jgi:hypothetical protein